MRAEVSGIWGGVTAAERANRRGMAPGARLDTLEAIHRQKVEESLVGSES
jgi:hypothetical protein